jgi:hypothetical protein
MPKLSMRRTGPVRSDHAASRPAAAPGEGAKPDEVVEPPESGKKEQQQRDPMKLHLIFAYGFLASLVVVGAMVWLFAAYETASWWWPAQEPKLSQDKWFEIVRNAVTTGAALGVGVTLFFSYRRQQTAEETQRIGAEAQRTAAKAQEPLPQRLNFQTSNMGWINNEASMPLLPASVTDMPMPPNSWGLRTWRSA